MVICQDMIFHQCHQPRVESPATAQVPPARSNARPPGVQGLRSPTSLDLRLLRIMPIQTHARRPRQSVRNSDPPPAGGHVRIQTRASGIATLPVPDEPLIDMRTLARWLSVSESTVRKWVARGPDTGLVPQIIRVNGQIRFRPSDVRDFLAAKEVR